MFFYFLSTPDIRTDGRTNGRTILWTALSTLTGGINHYVLYLLLDMSVYTTLTKEFKTGTVSIWTFCVLSDGRYRAYANNGKVLNFRSLEDFEKCVHTYKGYGYSSRSTQLVKQLSLI